MFVICRKREEQERMIYLVSETRYEEIISTGDHTHYTNPQRNNNCWFGNITKDEHKTRSLWAGIISTGDHTIHITQPPSETTIVQLYNVWFGNIIKDEHDTRSLRAGLTSSFAPFCRSGHVIQGIITDPHITLISAQRDRGVNTSL